MKVLFLDIDGVLNSHQSTLYMSRLKKKHRTIPECYEAYFPAASSMCPISISNLELILENIKDLKIVISSSWRIGEDIKAMKGLFKMSKIIPSRIIDTTPELLNQQRGDEIIYWVRNSKEKVTSFAVLDDDDDMDAVEDEFFVVDRRVGLDYLVAKQIIEYFNT